MDSQGAHGGFYEGYNDRNFGNFFRLAIAGVADFRRSDADEQCVGASLQRGEHL